MFEGFSQKTDPGSGRRMAVSTLASAGAFAALAALVMAFAGAAAVPAVAKKVQVVFRPPPPPAPVPEAAPPPPPQAPPPAPRKLKTTTVAADALPPPAPLVAPKEVPAEALAEAEPTGEPVAIASASGGGYGGASSGRPAAAVSTVGRAPVHLPERAAPPVALGSNRPPPYPEDARVRGAEGQVILKIVIDQEGRVASVAVMRGDEPFVTAAVQAVRSWRYRPATLDGQPISIYRVVKVPFRLRG